MSRILLIVLTLLPGISLGQEYYSKIISYPSSFINPNPIDLVVLNDKALVSTIDPSSNSSLIKFNASGEAERQFVIESFTNSTFPVNRLGDSFIFYGKNREIDSIVSILKLDENLILLESYNYDNQEVVLFPTSSANLSDLYISYVTTVQINRKAFVRRLNVEGQTIKEVPFGEQHKSTLIWKIVPTRDNKILVSSGIIPKDSFYHYGTVSILNEEGEIEWEHIADDIKDTGATPVYAEVYDDGTIIYNYILDRVFDEEYFLNEWYPFPVKMIWLSNEGEFIKEKTLITPLDNDYRLSNLSKGSNNSMYAFGNWNDFVTKDSYGWVVKMDNEGNELWSRKYQHESFKNPGYFQAITGVEEYENGDIAILMLVTQPGEINKNVLLRVNSKGCFNDSNCGSNETILVSTDKIESQLNYSIYPNPAYEKIIVESNIDKIKTISLTDLKGAIVFLESNLDIYKKEINIDNLNPGYYIVTITLQNNMVYSKLISIID